MARILLVEDEPDVGLYEARVLEAHGHTVIRCSGGSAAFAACPLLRRGSCALADGADLIVFSCRLFAPLRHRSYSGRQLLRAYRQHPVYGRIPMLVVSVGVPERVEGAGPMRCVAKYSPPNAVIREVEELLAGTGGLDGSPTVPGDQGRTARPAGAARS